MEKKKSCFRLDAQKFGTRCTKQRFERYRSRKIQIHTLRNADSDVKSKIHVDPDPDPDAMHLKTYSNMQFF